MEYFFIILLGAIFPYIERLMFKFNPYLYIDLCIGRKNFINFIKNDDFYKTLL